MRECRDNPVSVQYCNIDQSLRDSQIHHNHAYTYQYPKASVGVFITSLNLRMTVDGEFELCTSPANRVSFVRPPMRKNDWFFLFRHKRGRDQDSHSSWQTNFPNLDTFKLKLAVKSADLKYGYCPGSTVRPAGRCLADTQNGRLDRKRSLVDMFADVVSDIKRVPDIELLVTGMKCDGYVDGGRVERTCKHMCSEFIASELKKAIMK